MPNRIIRESALTSPTLSKLSHGAERLFWRLTIIADDAGRFDANPTVVKARCFPLMVDELRTADVIKFMRELSGECICLYTHEGRDYGLFPNWAKYQRVYGNSSKFPQPPAECGESPQVPATSGSYSYPISDIRESRIDIRESILAHPGMSGFVKFWDVYPRKKSKGDAEKAWSRLKPNEQLQDRILHALEQAKTSEDWTREGGKFIPYPASWLNKRGWEDDHRPVVDVWAS